MLNSLALFRGRHCALLVIPVLFAVVAVTSVRASGAEPNLFRLLDSNKDGDLGQFEAMSEWLRLIEKADKNRDGALSKDELKSHQDRIEREHHEEFRAILEECDHNGDEQLSLSEVPPVYRAAAGRADRDGNGLIVAQEFSTFEMTQADLVRSEIEELFGELDDDANGEISLASLPDELRKELAAADVSGDGTITIDEVAEHFAGATPSAQFDVRGEVAHMVGVIDGTTPARVLELVLGSPRVNTIALRDVPGSIDDEANLWAASLIRRFGLRTKVPSSGVIASGGVDFFLAGAERSVETGARLGVHSWGTADEQGRDLPRSDEAHRLYLDFYREIGIPASFYWFTLEAAPADSIHWMTADELTQFDCVTSTAQKSKGTESKGTDTPKPNETERESSELETPEKRAPKGEGSSRPPKRTSTAPFSRGFANSHHPGEEIVQVGGSSVMARDANPESDGALHGSFGQVEVSPLHQSTPDFAVPGVKLWSARTGWGVAETSDPQLRLRHQLEVSSGVDPCGHVLRQLHVVQHVGAQTPQTESAKRQVDGERPKPTRRFDPLVVEGVLLG